MNAILGSAALVVYGPALSTDIAPEANHDIVTGCGAYNRSSSCLSHDRHWRHCTQGDLARLDQPVFVHHYLSGSAGNGNVHLGSWRHPQISVRRKCWRSWQLYTDQKFIRSQASSAGSYDHITNRNDALTL
jgi:hypothetical protein